MCVGFSKLTVTGIWLLYNAVSVSPVQQNKSAIHTSSPLWTFSPFQSPQSMKGAPCVGAEAGAIIRQVGEDLVKSGV